MKPTGWLGAHPDEGELLAYSDRALSAVEHERLAAHVDDCEHCVRELATLQQMAQGVSAALGSVTVPPVSDIRKRQALKAVNHAVRRAERRRAWRGVYMPRAAAAVLMIFGAGVAAGPGWALVRSVFAGSSGVVAPLTMPPVVITERDELDVIDASRLHLEWNSPRFVLSFEQVGGGTVEFRRQEGRLATLQVLGAPASVISGVGGVVIKNDAAGSPRYVVTLPAIVTGVSITAGGSVQLNFAPVDGVRYDVRSLAQGRLQIVGGK